ncbi:thioredoxin family protein [Edwardsiella tarda]|uniref:Redox-active disulfide protein 2 n=2 Tax=Edwardsiella tarda TaxID=636 RepID=D4F663_EDWTA|nr:thioredoxin family protein [Edwardsiella tarda]AKH90626.2 thioredoxin family protein [Edwardsiella tarda]ATI65575.1 thioredoxin family protein [Edwardsiella tarda]EFE22749.1 redox-active disulfide protein 2 [Edwardsiella tarda ATCC 23685]UAL55350.1 thioredoxin family protein [Edwardsiella tarda]UCQ01600.1 thioredoxin family protein [Edwardsiella tarda ATCC 15947 = NBRC 105688]
MMKNIKVLGSGCANCKAVAKLIAAVAEDKGIAIELEKIEEIREIMSFGILSTPGVVVDGQVVHSGGIPSRDKIEQWLTA